MKARGERLGRRIVRGLAVAIFSLLVAEVLGQFVVRLSSGRWHFGRILEDRKTRRWMEMVFEPHPYLVAQLRPKVRVSDGSKVVSTTAMRTRTVPGAVGGHGAFRVACLGGSTTFGVGVDDRDTWPAALQEVLGNGFEVANFGVNGYSTAEAIIQMAFLVPEWNPEVVVFYEGWNDIRAYHEPGLTADYRALGEAQEGCLLPGSPGGRPGLLQEATGASVVASSLPGLLVAAGLSSSPPTMVYDDPDPEVDRLFVRNLVTLAALARRVGAGAIFVPQVLNDARYLQSAPGVAKPWTPHVADVAMPVLIRRFDGLMAGACREGDPDCSVIEDVLDAGWDPRDFIDAGHLSPRGSRKLAERIAPRIRALAARREMPTGTP